MVKILFDDVTERWPRDNIAHKYGNTCEFQVIATNSTVTSSGVGGYCQTLHSTAAKAALYSIVSGASTAFILPYLMGKALENEDDYNTNDGIVMFAKDMASWGL